VYLTTETIKEERQAKQAKREGGMEKRASTCLIRLCKEVDIS
jgi:hypothetical protein